MTRTKSRNRPIAGVAAAWAVLACATLAQAQGKPSRIDGLAAVVGGSAPSAGVDSVLLSDVELRARIAWSGRHLDEDALGPLPNAALLSGLNESISELLIAREAVRVKAEAPVASEVARERAHLVESAGGAARMQVVLRALGVSADELEAIARRRAAVGAFLSANLQGVASVTDSEVERALATSTAESAGGDRERARGELRARMSREALNIAIERWVSVLRSRTQVRIYVQY